jgi:hypothetical protein
MEEVTDSVSMQTVDASRYPGVTFDGNGEPVGDSIVDIFDELDREFVEFYGEYGRRMVNTRREAWNRQGPWRFELF